MNTLPPSWNNVLQKVTVGVAFLALFSAAPCRAQSSRELSNVVAFLGPDQQRLAWEVDANLLKELGQLDDLESPDASILSNALISAALGGDKDNKKKCCFEKVADGIWSCCDGTFVTTGAKSVATLFDLAAKSSEKSNDPADLSKKFRPFLDRFNDTGVFKSLGRDDPQMRDIPWEQMKTTREFHGR